LTYGVTDAGFVLKPQSAILDELAARQRAEIDPQWNTESDSLAGQYNGIIADAIAQNWEVLQATYHALSRAADGAALDAIGALNSTARRAATKSLVTLTLNLVTGTTVPAGSVVSETNNPATRVVTLAAASYSGVGSANVAAAARAESAGAVTANPGTLSVIETPVAGWTSATNADPLGGGLPIETDYAYRLRQLDELAAGGGGSVPGLRADLLKVDGVTAALVLENETDVAVDGLPGHSLEAVVLGGADGDVARAVFESKSAGIYTYGSAGPFTVTDDQGVDHAVRFSRPGSVVVYAALGLATVGDYAGIAAAAQTAVVAATIDPTDPGFLGIGADVYAGRIVVSALSVAGVLNARVGLSLSPITDPTLGSASLPITNRQLATLSIGHIVVSAL
jgi:uncharacterized phage protein gp47/JayE